MLHKGIFVLFVFVYIIKPLFLQIVAFWFDLFELKSVQ